MNTRFLMLLAALLLGSASAFAQSGNTTTLNGDVNGDGVVDVADINAIINIIKNNAGTATAYKYYVGTTDPSKTTWNESDLTMSSQNPITSFTAPAGTSDNPFTVWIYPTSWGTINSMKVGGETRNPWITPIPWNPTIPNGYTAVWTQFSGDTPITDITQVSEVLKAAL